MSEKLFIRIECEEHIIEEYIDETNMRTNLRVWSSAIQKLDQEYNMEEKI
tara:strand:+ start:175 stop:324 length:150 start_codon:yes stop_codon:yes gene_type:complete